MLPDGTYDALVVDADLDADDPTVVVVELTLLTGEHKGDLVSVRATGLAVADPIDLLATPATLTVTDGSPSLRLEP